MDKNKNVMAGFLMLVGVVFILIAGGVFVTTAWAYLPEVAKQFFLMALTAAFFGAAAYLYKREKLPRTEFALYYLGVAFCGYCSISFLGGCHFPVWGQEDAGRLLTASLLMLVPVVYRLLLDYRHEGRGIAFHMAVLLILLDSALVWGFIYCNLGYRMQLFVAAGTLLAYALADYFGKEYFKGSTAVQVVFYVEFLWHAVVYVFMCGIHGVRDYSAAEMLALAMMILLAAYIMWRSRQQIGWRIFHSVTLLWFVYVLVANLQNLGVITWERITLNEAVLFPAYALGIILLLVMQRGEMAWMLFRFAPFMAFIQLLDAAFGGEKYLPYSLFSMAGLLLLPLAKECKEAITYKLALPWEKRGLSGVWDLYTNEEGKRYLIAGILQGLSAAVLLMAFVGQNSDEQYMVLWILLTISLANSALLSKYKLWSRILGTIALLPGMSVFWTCPWVEVPRQFTVEYGCIWAELAVVLLGYIWYDIKDIKIVQFILNCHLLGILLLWNLCGGELANALLLGGISMVMILLAAFLHRKNYMLAGSISLFLLVVYATRGLWLNIAWWVYLLLAGVVLIILASHTFSKGEVED